jgi:hypothetical protein
MRAIETAVYNRREKSHEISQKGMDSVDDLHAPTVFGIQRGIDLEWEACKPWYRFIPFVVYCPTLPSHFESETIR